MVNPFPLANWYEDRLAVDQLYQRKPELKIVNPNQKYHYLIVKRKRE
jgi:hypothetical protein